MNRLNLEHIGKTYGTKDLFHDVTLGIDSGERIGLIGVNGTGKSTLLKIVAGIVESDEGQVICGRDVTISYLAQNPEYPEDETVLGAVMPGRRSGTEEEAQARSMLNRLGMTDHDALMGTLSGGQRKRVALAQTLLSEAELLILDEPTNHLDQDMILWLEDWLLKFKGELLLVTHDRYFLDRVTTRIAELDRGDLYTYEGNYETYLEKKAERLEQEARGQHKRENLMRTELAWIRRGAQARSTKQQARIHRFEDLQEASRQARRRLEQSTLTMGSVTSRLGKKTLELEHIHKAFGRKVVVDDFSYIFLRDDRIGIIGPNGCGKSTLMNIIAGVLEPDSGSVVAGETVRIGYFRQESVMPDETQTVLEYVKNIGEYVRTTDGLITASQMCEKFLFDPRMQWAKISALSGGERRRLYLLSVLMTQPNVLLLDEPTNDLDIETLEILEDYLDHFLGIVITVSHDRYFLDRIVSRIFAFEEGGEWKQYEGGFTDYYEKRREEAASGADAAGRAGMAAGGSSGGNPTAAQLYAQQKSASRRKKMSYREQQEYDHIDEEIAALEERIRELDAQIQECATQYTKLEELTKQKEEVQDQLSAKEERWLILNELAEEIAAQT